MKHKKNSDSMKYNVDLYLSENSAKDLCSEGILKVTIYKWIRKIFWLDPKWTFNPRRSLLIFKRKYFFSRRRVRSEKGYDHIYHKVSGTELTELI